MTKQAQIDVSGNVRIPEDVRTALAVGPGDLVEFEVDGDGRVTLRNGDREAYRRRYKERLAHVRAVSEQYRHLRTGQSTDDYMAEIREPLPCSLSIRTSSSI